jgi:mono/diheme cytochrome c family protein
MPILKLTSLCILLLWGSIVLAQTYDLGRIPTEEEMITLDIDVSPIGEGLPLGRGNAEQGAQVFIEKGCIGCHGANLTGGPAPRLLRSEKGSDENPWDYGKILPIRAPYATVVWDYINRAMPLGREGTLTPNEVYSLVAFLLSKNGVIKEDMVLDNNNLAKIQMPNRDTWAPLPDWKKDMDRLEGYPY